MCLPCHSHFFSYLVSGKKVRVYYHWCRQHAIESMFELHLTSETIVAVFMLKKNGLHVLYYVQHIEGII